jgi:DnaK suppressor protein
MTDFIDADYVPSEDEPFMNERQKAYFRAKLVSWKSDILREARETLEILQQENANHPDLADRASSETDRAIELRARDRQRKLIPRSTPRCSGSTKAHTAIARRRASRSRSSVSTPGRSRRLSIEAQERHERREKVYRDD